MDNADIRDSIAPPFSPSKKSNTRFSPKPQAGNFWKKFMNMLDPFTPNKQPNNKKQPQSHDKQPSNTQPSNTQPSNTQPSNTQPSNGSYAHNLQEAENKTHPQFKPILRGDEAQQDAKIHDQASFGKAVDEVAKEYGLDPNMFRAQLQKESGAFTQGYQKAMHQEGDLGRASDNNTSIGLGQISRKFLDGRDWSDGGPNNPRVGGKTVTTEQYMNSPITQLRVAAANIAMRIADNGGVERGLLSYVSGHPTRDAQNGNYVDSINKLMQDGSIINIGR